MAKIGGTPSASFKIWEVPEDSDPRRRARRLDEPEIDSWRSCGKDKHIGDGARTHQQKVTIFPRRGRSNESLGAGPPKKTPENSRIPSEVPKAPMKPRRAAKAIVAVPKKLEFAEAEDENAERMAPEIGSTQRQSENCYPTRTRMSSVSRMGANAAQPTALQTKPTKSRSKKKGSDLDKENDGNATNRSQPRQGTSANNRKRLPLKAVQNKPENIAAPEELNTGRAAALSESSNNTVGSQEQQRVGGLWIECCRQNCGKWRFSEEYRDPIDVPEIWYCEMNSDPRFADCSAPEEHRLASEDKHLVLNSCSVGNMVWARVKGFPWWPAMVDYCVDSHEYFLTDGASKTAHKYNVTLFDEKNLLRAWVPVKNLKPYASNLEMDWIKKTAYRGKEYKAELRAAYMVATQAWPLSNTARLEKFSFVSRSSAVADATHITLPERAHDEVPANNHEDPLNADHIFSAYGFGGILWARTNGFPWWPAIVDQAPGPLPVTEYHVEFFSEGNFRRPRAVPPRDLKSYEYNPREFPQKTIFKNKDWTVELQAACALADQALERLRVNRDSPRPSAVGSPIRPETANFAENRSPTSISADTFQSATGTLEESSSGGTSPNELSTDMLRPVPEPLPATEDRPFTTDEPATIPVYEVIDGSDSSQSSSDDDARPFLTRRSCALNKKGEIGDRDGLYQVHIWSSPVASESMSDELYSSSSSSVVPFSSSSDEMVHRRPRRFRRLTPGNRNTRMDSEPFRFLAHPRRDSSGIHSMFSQNFETLTSNY